MILQSHLNINTQDGNCGMPALFAEFEINDRKIME